DRLVIVEFVAEPPKLLPALALDLGSTHLEATLLDLLTGEPLARGTTIQAKGIWIEQPRNCSGSDSARANFRRSRSAVLSCRLGRVASTRIRVTKGTVFSKVFSKE
ncbi:MAG: hypothetical protein D3917_14790, partial [Candidatus Electrothrix sp. AX5]|nr:hypothetical protein [Candidatus Electrothrix sp. AX5]